MQYTIVGDTFQGLKVELTSEKIWGDYTKLLSKSEGVTPGDNNIFSGTGILIFSGNGQIKEFVLSTGDTIILRRDSIVAADTTTTQTSISTPYASWVEFTGPGTVFINGKEFIEFYIEEEDIKEVRTCCIVAMDSTLTYEPGSRFTVLVGPGAVLLETIIHTEPEDTETKFSFFDQV
ncbi:MAG: AIM24 family protein [Candidatus Methanofastidiosia archaeon]|jgi:uncharacterized protein (AIM24 family)